MVIVLFEEAQSPDIYYRAGFDSDAPVLLIDGGTDATLYVPGFEYYRAKKECENIDVQPLKQLKEILEAIMEPVTTNKKFPYYIAQHIKTEITVKQEVYEQRRIKTAEEIKHITHAQKLTKQAIHLVTEIIEQSTLREGILYYKDEVLTSEYLKLQARTVLLKHKADCPNLIIASGTQTGQPHNRGTGPITQGLVIIDIFAQTHTKYHGDCTRTLIVGENQEAQKMLEAVKTVHGECIQKCVPGQNISELHTYATKRLTELGYPTENETGFIHSLGHGVGVAIHESPNISSKNTKTLEKGMAITIEPGLYYEIGARHEDIVLVQNTPKIL